MAEGDFQNGQTAKAVRASVCSHSQMGQGHQPRRTDQNQCTRREENVYPLNTVRRRLGAVGSSRTKAFLTLRIERQGAGQLLETGSFCFYSPDDFDAGSGEHQERGGDVTVKDLLPRSGTD